MLRISLAGVVALAVTAACQSGSGTSADGQQPRGTASPAGSSSEFIDCMRLAGWAEDEVRVQQEELSRQLAGGGGRPSLDPQTQQFVNDLMHCQQEAGMVTHPTGDGAPVDVYSFNASMREYVQCLRDRGWQVPDPVPDADDMLQPPLDETDIPAEDLPTWFADEQQCLEQAGLLSEDEMVDTGEPGQG